MADPIAIPGPPGLPLLGNLTDIDPTNVVVSFNHLADTYGILNPLCSLKLWYFADRRPR